METYTITFCETAENHVGMEKIGSSVSDGFTCQELWNVNQKYPSFTEYYQLNTHHEHEPASFLIIRGGLEFLDINHMDMFMEQKRLNKDKHALMRGRVCNKKARWNLCFADFDQQPDYENGKGTVVNFCHLPLLNSLRDKLPSLFGPKSVQLNAEGNYYYDISQCYISYHGDAERRRVIGVRLGYTMPIHFRWYLNSERQGDKLTVYLNSGDIYIMSEKAVGTDWKKRSIWTLRHAAGYDSKDFAA